jgi:hypothetical protein
MEDIKYTKDSAYLYSTRHGEYVSFYKPPTYLSPIQGTETETETDYCVYSKLLARVYSKLF